MGSLILHNATLPPVAHLGVWSARFELALYALAPPDAQLGPTLLERLCGRALVGRSFLLLSLLRFNLSQLSAIAILLYKF
jgi:hypothetical protein